MTRGELIDELAAQLGARHEARFIAEEVMGPSTDDSPDAPQLRRARAMAARRCDGEPLQYIFGHWSFRSLDLIVDRRVLIPRPETEQVVEVALAEVAPPARPDLVVVDAGTGSGAIALSLAAELAERGHGGVVYAVDVSADALAVAEANLARQPDGVPRLAVTLVAGHWLEPLPADLIGAVDLIVSNPPYVTADEWAALDAEVQAEPLNALVAGAGSEGTPGLADVEAVLTQSRQWLGRPGSVVVELAPHQAEAAQRMASTLGYDDVAVLPDLSGRPRAVVGRLW